MVDVVVRRADLHPVGVLGEIHGTQLAGRLAPADVGAELGLAEVRKGFAVRGGGCASLLAADKVVDEELGVDDRLEGARVRVGLDVVVEAPESSVSPRSGGGRGDGNLPLLKLGFKLPEHLDDTLVRRQAGDDAVHILAYVGGIPGPAGRDKVDGKAGKELGEGHPRLEKDPDGVEIRHQPSSGVVHVGPAGFASLPLPFAQVLLADELFERGTIATFERIQELPGFEDDFDGVSCQRTWATGVKEPTFGKVHLGLSLVTRRPDESEQRYQHLQIGNCFLS